MRIGTAILVIWLVIGAFAAAQRGYFGDDEDVSCWDVDQVGVETEIPVVAAIACRAAAGERFEHVLDQQRRRRAEGQLSFDL